MRLDHLLSKEYGPELGPPCQCTNVVLVVIAHGWNVNERLLLLSGLVVGG